MSAYHQMGNDSWNLVMDGNLGPFEGMVLSPVNDTPEDTCARLAALGLQRQLLDVVFDPQVYKPSSDRGRLLSWNHYPKDIESSDLADRRWWDSLAAAAVEAAGHVRANSVCSPASLTNTFDDEYFEFLVERADATYAAAAAADARLSALMTCIVSPAELTKQDRAMHVASVLSRTKCDRAYLILHDGLQPKTQYRDHSLVLGVMRLIAALEGAGIKVLVACTGVDMCLWKLAGASSVATGKFFNLRRFTPGRWEEPTSAGGAVPHWTEFAMFTWLRELDVKLLKSEGRLDLKAAESNPYSRAILPMLEFEEERPDKWLAFSWRQYLYEFSRKEREYRHDPAIIVPELIAADKQWGAMEGKLLLYERSNDGGWIRPWLNAVRQFQQ